MLLFVLPLRAHSYKSRLSRTPACGFAVAPWPPPVYSRTLPFGIVSRHCLSVLGLPIATLIYSLLLCLGCCGHHALPAQPSVFDLVSGVVPLPTFMIAIFATAIVAGTLFFLWLGVEQLWGSGRSGVGRGPSLADDVGEASQMGADTHAIRCSRSIELGE